MKSASRSFLTAVRRNSRTYATQVAGKHSEQKPSFPPQDPKVTRLPNGIVVASLENYAPISRVAVVYNAGPRYEPIGQLGLTHCLRAASNLSSQKATAFGIARSLQQIGASLSCTTTREHMLYTLTCKRDDLSTATEFLGNVATSPTFKPWELDGLARRLRLDLELFNRSLNVRLIEAVHKAAFRDTLGRSLYMTADRIGTFTSENLEAFVNANYVAGNMAVAGVGVDHEELVKLVGKMDVRQGAAPSELHKAKYHSGELRVDVKSNLVHAAIVTEGVSLSSSDIVPTMLLNTILGTAPSVQYGTGNAVSKINKAAAAAVTGSFAASCINASYSDAGLFGVQAVASPQDIGKVLKAVVDMMGQLTKSGVTDEELQRAKQKLKAMVYMDSEDSANVLDCMAPEALLAGEVFVAAAVEKAIDGVTVDTVNKVAKRIINGRPTMAAVGDLVNTPYLDQLL